MRHPVSTAVVVPANDIQRFANHDRAKSICMAMLIDGVNVQTPTLIDW